MNFINRKTLVFVCFSLSISTAAYAAEQKDQEEKYSSSTNDNSLLNTNLPNHLLRNENRKSRRNRQAHKRYRRAQKREKALPRFPDRLHNDNLVRIFKHLDFADLTNFSRTSRACKESVEFAKSQSRSVFNNASGFRLERFYDSGAPREDWFKTQRFEGDVAFGENGRLAIFDERLYELSSRGSWTPVPRAPRAHRFILNGEGVTIEGPDGLFWTVDGRHFSEITFRWKKRYTGTLSSFRKGSLLLILGCNFKNRLFLSQNYGKRGSWSLFEGTFPTLPARAETFRGTNSVGILGNHILVGGPAFSGLFALRGTHNYFGELDFSGSSFERLQSMQSSPDLANRARKMVIDVEGQAAHIATEEGYYVVTLGKRGRLVPTLRPDIPHGKEIVNMAIQGEKWTLATPNRVIITFDGGKNFLDLSKNNIALGNETKRQARSLKINDLVVHEDKVTAYSSVWSGPSATPEAAFTLTLPHQFPSNPNIRPLLTLPEPPARTAPDGWTLNSSLSLESESDKSPFLRETKTEETKEDTNLRLTDSGHSTSSQSASSLSIFLQVESTPAGWRSLSDSGDSNLSPRPPTIAPLEPMVFDEEEQRLEIDEEDE